MYLRRAYYTGVLTNPYPARKETSKEACQGLAQFQQHRDASFHKFLFPTSQGAEGNSSHSARNISFCLPCRGKDLSAPL